ncbi:hypothetical protein [Streptomyces boluensis]|uniref:Uncharacterized protein n=1 Tax=Streptomyces boluensis TaxID=1775135 RepID=A0A964UMW4_9ACTN|nr:hypothetical protein [Streptomyces boluensis]NBE51986.1 hypothetical protein [Streptomyces boluensis]
MDLSVFLFLTPDKPDREIEFSMDWEIEFSMDWDSPWPPQQELHFDGEGLYVATTVESVKDVLSYEGRATLLYLRALPSLSGAAHDAHLIAAKIEALPGITNVYVRDHERD